MEISRDHDVPEACNNSCFNSIMLLRFSIFGNEKEILLPR